MADGKWTLAVLNKDGVLQSFETVTDELLWVRSEGRFPVPDACDLALKRYHLVRAPNGKERFEPIMHVKDEGAENNAASIPITKILTRSVMMLAAGEAVRADDQRALAEWLTTFDGVI